MILPEGWVDVGIGHGLRRYDAGIRGVVFQKGLIWFGCLCDDADRCMTQPVGAIAPIGAAWATDGQAWFHLEAKRRTLLRVVGVQGDEITFMVDVPRV